MSYNLQNLLGAPTQLLHLPVDRHVQAEVIAAFEASLNGRRSIVAHGAKVRVCRVIIDRVFPEFPLFGAEPDIAETGLMDVSDRDLE